MAARHDAHQQLDFVRRPRHRRGDGDSLHQKPEARTKPEGYYPLVSLSSVWGMALFFAAIGLTLVLAYTGETPFIYAQF